MTCMLAPQQDYTDYIEPDPDHLVHDMKLLQERQGEAGISGTVRKVNAYETKLKKDKIFLDQKMPEYEFLSFYQDVLTKKRRNRRFTVICFPVFVRYLQIMINQRHWLII